MSPSPSPSPSQSHETFSVRIVSIDYYMSPPIPDIDLRRSAAFQGRKVEEVPVIRIYGSTPAGQKACLHVHQALPYLYIPCPEDVLQNPEEGHTFVNILSRSLEKALRSKSTAPRRQHIHGCHFVRAKKIYGYHASDDLFVKIYLYYPHEVPHLASLLLVQGGRHIFRADIFPVGGAILNKTFQPYESHIPYLLQFLVDYNLYGMGHIHTSRFKFRLPIPNNYIHKVDSFKKYDMQALGNSAIWLSSTVPSVLIWPDSAVGTGGLEARTNNLISRQSVCDIEVDASVDDIINEKCKMYSSLSQTRSEVKMVQSLVPIWEEEYERSGTPEAAKSPVISKPLPKIVLRRFLHGLEYDLALSELCTELEKTYPSEVSAIEGDKLLENSIRLLTNSGETLQLLEPHRGNCPSQDSLSCLKDECKSIPSTCILPHKHKEAVLYEKIPEIDQLKSNSEESLSEMCGNANKEGTDSEALGLLSWLASSQAMEEFTADDELVHEAILNPLFPTKSYSETLEIAHLDYESASQQECQDILDSAEDFLKTEGLKEHKSFSACDDDSVNVSSVNLIPQRDGSSDENVCVPQKGDKSETNTTSGRAKSSSDQMGKGTSRTFAKKCRSKLLWGPLPFPIKDKDQEDFKCGSLVSSQKEMESYRGCGSSVNEGIRSCERVHMGVETTDEKEGNMDRTFSMRDLMRKKRCLRTEQLETELQDSDMVASCPEVSKHHIFDKGRYYLLPTETSKVESSGADLDDVVQENEPCFTTSKQDACMEGYDISSVDDFGSKPKLSLPLSDQETRSNVHLNQPLPFNKTFKDGEGAVFNTGSQSLVVTGQMGPAAETIKISESCQTMHLRSAVCNMYLGGHEDGMTEASPSTMKSYKHYVRSQFTSQSSEDQSGSRHSEFHQYESHSGDELLKENHNSWTEDFINAHPEQTSAQHRQDGQITQEEYLELDFNSGSHKGKDTLNHLDVTFSRTPPSRYEVDGLSEECPESAIHVSGTSNINAELMPFCSVGACRQWVNELPPFFGRNPEDEKLYKLYLNDKNHVYPRESALGVPTHFQNDGSVLYLLTHAVSPPTQECVYQWLLGNLQRDHLNDSSGDTYGGVSPESNVANILKTDIPLSSQDDIKPHKNRNHTSDVDIVYREQHTVSMCKKENALEDNGRDLSQISCPDQEEKSRLTPLSQIGFSDPANIGGGQQLTLISIEVQAESRGDLRPDPLIDGINILSFAIQEDTSHTLDVYVLIRCNNEESRARNVDGVPEYKFLRFNEEKLLLDHFVKIISSIDPDVLMGWEVQGGSLGFLAKRAARLGINLLKKISRVPAYDSKHETTDSVKTELSNVNHEELIADTSVDDSIVEDEWGRTHASGIHVRGRIVLNIWRLMRSELKLNMYSIEAVAEEVLRQKIPSISCQVLNRWFSSGPERARYRCIEYVTERAKLNLQIMNKLDMINRTSELARVFGIDFFSVLSRGSQFRVESMLLRLAHTQNYVAISPGNHQVASQPAMECLPLVMEPESGFYSDPVVVLDFQSLYPSMIIAYNLCFSTCLGPVIASKANILGVSSYMPDPVVLKDLKEDIFLTPNGVMYVPPKVRKGVLPRLLEEILSTRIMLKQAIKKLTTSQQVLQRILNARQLALKLIANVTYGYTAAGFSGRMPCAELADSIVQCGRRTLESSISFVNTHDKWKARVIYGDTDSMFVLLKGRSREEAFRIGYEIASAITALNPNPVTLKMEKVYHPCFLLTKKRYVGYSFESPDQDKPSFDAKGIETVRRDTCPAVAKNLERSIRLFFDHQDISIVKSYLQRQWRRILSGKISLQDFVFAKEVRLGTYSTRASALPPAAIVATKAMRIDPRAEPQYGERVPYLVIHGEPGARLVDMVVDPSVLLEINSPYRLNELYYITKQIIPALQRVFGLVGGDLKQWFAELPRPVRPTLAKRHSYVSHSGSLNEYDDDNMSGSSKKAQVKRSRIDTYYISKHCALCGDLAQASTSLCNRCSKEPFVAAAVIGKASKLEREIQHLVAICRHCGGADWVIERGVKCTSLACSVFYERRKVQKEFRSISSFAAASGFYPTCTPEWF